MAPHGNFFERKILESIDCNGKIVLVNKDDNLCLISV